MKVFIHLGAHKTGTTYFQGLMEHNLKVLAKNGIGFFPIGKFRRNILPEALGHPSVINCLGVRAQESYSENIENLLVSEENIIGTCPQIIATGRLYPNAGKNIHRYSGEGVSFLLCVRNMVNFLPSAWAESLRSSSSYTSFEEFMEKVKIENFSWFDVVRNIQQAAEGCKIYVWRYEDNQRALNKLIALVSEGRLKLGDLHVPSNIYGRPSMAQHGYEFLKLMDTILGRDVASAYCKKVSISAVVSELHSSLNIFPENLVEAFSLSYRKDIDRIRGMPNVTLWDSEPESSH